MGADNMSTSTARAVLKNVPISAQKLRLSADLVRGKSVNKALNVLNFSVKKSAKIVSKVLMSAAANAENNNGLDLDELFIKEIFVDQARSAFRLKARAKGRSNRIIKRSSHLTIVVAEQDEENN